MSKIVWHKTIICTDSDQNIHVFPNESFDGIVVETFELDDQKHCVRIDLDMDTMEMLIDKMREMMYYIQQQKKQSAK